MKRVSVLALIAVHDLAQAAELTSPIPKAGPLAEASESGIGYKSVAEALSALTANPKVTITDENGWKIAREDLSIWSFAPMGHPAYPAVVKRSLLEKDGALVIDMRVLCEAAKDPCDALVRDFEALNGRMIESVRNPDS